MGVYIPRKTKPECCADCPCMRHDSMDGAHGFQCNLTLNTLDPIGVYINHLPEDCPLVEVKEPHGRLVDTATAYQDTMQYGNHFRESVLKIINDLPTVIGEER